MATSYFRVMATDATPTFEPISQWMGVWSGVAKVEDDAEISRLKKLGRAELTAEQYESESKKKASLRQGFQDYREVASGLSLVQPAVESGDQKPAEPSQQTIESVTKPAPVPPRRRSQQVPS